VPGKLKLKKRGEGGGGVYQGRNAKTHFITGKKIKESAKIAWWEVTEGGGGGVWAERSYWVSNAVKVQKEGKREEKGTDDLLLCRRGKETTSSSDEKENRNEGS